MEVVQTIISCFILLVSQTKKQTNINCLKNDQPLVWLIVNVLSHSTVIKKKVFETKKKKKAGLGFKT